MMGGYGWGAGMIVASILWLVLVVALVWIAAFVARRATREDPSSNARRILDERFARGDIDAEELRSRRAALSD